MTTLDALTLIALRDAANDGREQLADYDSGEVEYMRDGLAAAYSHIAARALRDAADDAEQRAGTTTDDLACADDEMFVRLGWLRERADRLEADVAERRLAVYIMNDHPWKDKPAAITNAARMAAGDKDAIVHVGLMIVRWMILAGIVGFAAGMVVGWWVL